MRKSRQCSHLTVSSIPRVKTVRPSTENTMEHISTPFACAPSTDKFGRTKLELAFHMWMAPS